MATPEQTKTALAAQDKPRSLQDVIQASAKELGRALPDHMRPERVVRIALTCIRQNPALAECTQESFLGALFTAAQIGVEPIAGRAYLIPFKNSRKKADGTWHKVSEAQFVIGYKGLAELFYRHEKAVELAWGVVREGDDFDYEYGTSAYLKHKPNLGSYAKPPVAYWVQATLKNGGKPFRVASHEECMQHGRDHSKTWLTRVWDDAKKKMVDCAPHFAKDSPWNTDPESMCLKTTLIQLAKLLPLSVELQRAIQADESSRDYRRGMSDALDAPSTTAWKGDGGGQDLPQTAISEKTEAEEPESTPEPIVAPLVSEKTGKEIGFGE